MSQLGWLFPIYGKIKNVPNHQPIFICWPLRVTFRYPWKIIQAEWLQTFSINGLMAIPKNVQFTTPKSSPWHICVYCLGTTPILGSPLGAAVEVTHGWFTVVLNLNKLGYQLYNYRYIYNIYIYIYTITIVWSYVYIYIYINMIHMYVCTYVRMHACMYIHL